MKSASFSWTEEYAVHMEDMDVQHRRLAELVRELGEAFAVGEPSQVTGCFQRLIVYTKMHCADEEQFMLTLGYPRLDEHIRTHDVLIEDMRRAAEAWENGGGVTAGVIDEIATNLDEHLRDDDQEYSRFLELRRVPVE